MRDFLDAARSRVVVFDGSMGALLEEMDLSLEQDYRLPGRAHEALVLNRPLFSCIYTDLLNSPKTRASVEAALAAVEERAKPRG